ncbi:MAG: putative nucleotide-diphospho-sugar transferase [Verrucomicrobiota bacterium]|nr:putative nucleotide-diphospho-sugar transferase [Verrucomicrobiota bacterium]
MIAPRLKDGAWSGRPCYIVGGGPSLKGFDWSRLDTELTIGINRAFEFFDPTVTFSIDWRFYGWLTRGQLGDGARQRWRDYQGVKFFVNKDGAGRFEPGMQVVGFNRAHPMSPSIELGLNPADNSGYAALNLAMCLGANPIYLLGFDMAGNGAGKQAWFHTGYSVNQGDHVYANMIRHFERAADALAARGIEVVNLNPESHLRCFPFATIDDVPASPPLPMVVGYYTAGTGYEKEAKGLIESLRVYGLEYDIRAIQPTDWQRATQYKATFLAEMVHLYHGQTIVYTDADSRIERYPALFADMDGDIAFHRRRGRELLSGTLFLRCNDATADLMERWRAECLRRPNTWDQQCLDAALDGWRGRVGTLPEEYCCIFDTRPMPAEPVIVHRQASRRLKREAHA